MVLGRRLLRVAASAAALLALACGGGSGGGASTPPTPTRPTIASFTASPASLNAGQSTLLAWSASGATSLRIDQGVGDVTGQSSKSVTPSASLTYTLTATNDAGSVTATVPITVAAGDPFAAVTAAIEAAQSQYPSGLCVEILTPAGVVYSQSFGGFTNQTFAAVASSSKWVSGTVFMKLVEDHTLDLDMKMKDWLKDRGNQPWSGNMGEIRLRDLLSFTSGIPGDLAAAGDSTITLEEASLRMYDAYHATAVTPASSFTYGGNHMRIAAHLAEVVTGKNWRTLFHDTLQSPLGWANGSTYGNGTNPDPAGSLACTGQEYVRFVMMQLRKGMYGSSTLLASATIDTQRTDAFGSSTAITSSPYQALGKVNHYGFGNWLEAQNGQAPSPTNPIQRVSSTGKFGWAPWVEVGNGQNWAAVIMCQLPDSGVLIFAPSENLKGTIAPLIPAALAQNPPVLRTVP